MKAKWLPFIEKSAGLSRPGVGGLACIGDALPRPHVSRKPEKWKITFRNAPVHSPLEHPRTAVTFASVSDPDRTAVELVNRVPRPTDQTEDLAERPKEYRRVRIPFKATCAVTETDSSRMVVAQITQLGRFGCFVQTRKPYRKGTRVHVEIIESGATFVASGVVAYVTGDGMGIVFSMVESESSEVLTTWLSRKPRQFHRYSFAATAEVKELGSWTEQVLIIRDLGAGGCFVKTTAPLPKGSRIRVRIEHARAEFTAIARVTDNVTTEGMGIEFIEMELSDRAILEKWLGEKSSP